MKKTEAEQINRFAEMFSAMGTESGLWIMRLPSSAHPNGLVVGDIGSELEIPSSTLSHHLEKLKNQGFVRVRREGTVLWCSANTEGLRELLGLLYAECCTRDRVVEPENTSFAASKEEFMSTENIKEVVREKYGKAALQAVSGSQACCGGSSCCETEIDPITAGLYDSSQTQGLPEEAVLASLGCVAIKRNWRN